MQVMSRRTIDGLRLAAHLRPLRDRNGLAELFQETPFEQIAAAERPKVIAALTAWLTWADTFFQQTAPPANLDAGTYGVRLCRVGKNCGG